MSQDTDDKIDWDLALQNLTFFSKKENKLQKGFNLYPAQKEIFNEFITNKSQVILKARQLGISTITAAYLFVKFVTSDTPITIAIISHKLDSAKHIFNIYKSFYDYLCIDPKVKNLLKLSDESKTSMKLSKSGAEIICLSSQSDGGLRSYSINYAHISEFAFQSGADELLSSSIASLHSPGQVIIESTANYYGDPLYKLIEEIKADDEPIYNFIFSPWHRDPTYKLKITSKTFNLTNEEVELKEKYNLSDEQLNWRRVQIKKLKNDVERFQREYPSDEYEAYQSLGTTYFSQRIIKHYKEQEVLLTEPHTINYFEEPDNKKKYVIGVDVAGGTGGDYSSVYVLDGNKNLIANYYSNKIEPASLADLVVTLSKRYNKALINIESNSFGQAVIDVLKRQYFYSNNLWRENEKHWLTTSKSKIHLMETIRNILNNQEVNRIDDKLLEELNFWRINQKGIIEYPSNLESHGDNTIAFGLALIASDRIKYSAINQQHDPWLADLFENNNTGAQYSFDSRY